MYIVVGLGNPGKEYERTRHNAGRMALDFIADEVPGIKVAETRSYMNVSGPAVLKAMSGEKPENLIVIHDDLDLPVGSMRISRGRGSGGHKGIESIIKSLGTKEFMRIRIGIAPVNIFGKMKKPKGEREVERFVLSEFRKSESEKLGKVFEKVQSAVEVIAKDGLAPAMTEFNR